MSIVQSFEPVIGLEPKVLILGSMPGIASLTEHQYYAHPRNSFWPIMAQLLDIEWSPVYSQRVSQLRQYPLILWDVLRACDRKGSLDSAILTEGRVANDIAGLLSSHPTIRCIVFNGGAADKMFKQQVASTVDEIHRFDLLRMPSTSPAHASQNFEQKLDQWLRIADYFEIPRHKNLDSPLTYGNS